ncbi:hypothetical protein EFK50_15255 [Nocardioides marmoriginsengisoli]|uniref:EfeO-type cupredoxin-like domain-containing protein n=1 Tax=Nocardioides marmoriginsengisoli TaxID=661483 RepID=A0A3N0CIB7_9ACTN|nr:hypothetical protein [Nocardioides marmoriginsengisoli]RNL63069.1 hypothetical protein EFK50_15255 [Nocardioides marmoriginsengisoli]
MTPRPRALHVGAATLLLLALTACGSSAKDTREAEEPTVVATPTAQVTGTPAADAKVVDITITADSVTPSGAQIAIKRNQPVVLRIDAAEAGQLHAHSSPEQHIGFPAGDSEVTISFDKPGVIAVEDHALDRLIVQFEVS